MNKKGVVILGAGLTGLSVAYHLKKKNINYQLFEKESQPGGLCRSKNVKGFTFDYAEHFLRIPNSYVCKVIKDVIPRLHFQNVNAAININKRYVPYPFQKNLYALSKPMFKECVEGYVEAYKNNAKKPAKNFEQWIMNTMGKGIAKNFMIPYNKKIWTLHPRKMNTSWLRDEVVHPPKLHNIVAVTKKRKKEKMPRWYPFRGGSGAIPQAFSARLENVYLNKKVSKIDLKEKSVSFFDGEKVFYKKLISTISLTEMKNIIKKLPKNVKDAISCLRYNSVLCVNLGISGRHISDMHWIYFPEKKYSFARVYFPSNCSPYNAPIGRSSVSAITTYSKSKPLKKDVVRKTVLELREAGILRKSDRILVKDIMHIKYGFPIPTLDRDKNVKIIQTFLRKNNIFSIGRYGNWEYSGMEHAIMAGKELVHKNFLGKPR